MNIHSAQDPYSDIEFLGSADNFSAEILAALNKGILFNEFYEFEIEELCRFMHCFNAPPDTLLLREGEKGDHMIILMSGKVDVRKADADGSSRRLAMVGPGAILGEMSLIDGEQRFADCIAAEATRFAVISKSDLEEILALHPRLGNKLLSMLLQIMVVRLRDMSMRAIAPPFHGAHLGV